MSNDESIEILKDIRRWVKIFGIQESMPVLQDILSDDDLIREKSLRAVYHLSDGTNSNSDIAEKIPYSAEFIRLRQNEWADLGLLERENKNTPYAQLVSLNEAGIEVPELPVKEADEDE